MKFFEYGATAISLSMDEQCGKIISDKYEQLRTFCIYLVKGLLPNPCRTILPPSEIVMVVAAGLESMEISI